MDITNCVIRNDNLFKLKLGIGEDAYKFLKAQKNLVKIYDVVSFGATGSAVAASSVVANTFFASSGFLSIIGIGAAATPIGWVIAAGLISGGAYYGVSNIFQKHKNGMVKTVPEFINTPLDLLAVGISNLLIPLALKIAYSDDEFHETEKEHIIEYFSDEWGYEKQFIESQITDFESKILEIGTDEIISSFTDLVKNNPDCNANEMAKELTLLLKEISMVDGIIDDREEEFIAYVENLINGSSGPDFFERSKAKLSDMKVSLSQSADDLKSSIFSIASRISDTGRNQFNASLKSASAQSKEVVKGFKGIFSRNSDEV